MSLSPVLQLENDFHTSRVIEEMIKHTERNPKSSAEPWPLSGHMLSNEQEDGVVRGIIELYLAESPTLLYCYLSDTTFSRHRASRCVAKGECIWTTCSVAVVINAAK